MKVIIFGASGMVGQGVLRECLQANDVESILSINRSELPASPKLKQLIVKDLEKLDVPPAELTGYDACFFCLGVSAAGMSEEQYSRFTYDLTLNIAAQLVKLNSNMSFIYVSGAGTDSTEQGKIMWARVKGKTENALLKLQESRLIRLDCSIELFLGQKLSGSKNECGFPLGKGRL